MKQHTSEVRMKSRISEGSCDTEDWRNDAENSAFWFSEDTGILNCNNISLYFLIK